MDPARLAAIVAGARAGRQDSYQELLDHYGPRLYGYFYRTTGSHHDAEDLLGEIMLRLVRTLPNYDDRGRFEPWLFRIAANLLRDRIRRSRVRPATASLEAEDADAGTLGEVLSGNDVPADAGLLRSEQSVRVEAVLARLDEVSRSMVLLRHFAELSFKEIAAIFDCPVGTVLAKVHRALRSMRAMMERDDERG